MSDASDPAVSLLTLLDRVRRDRDVTYREIAEASGLNMQHVAKVLHNPGGATLRTVARIADSLGFDLELRRRP